MRVDVCLSLLCGTVTPRSMLPLMHLAVQIMPNHRTTGSTVQATQTVEVPEMPASAFVKQAYLEGANAGPLLALQVLGCRVQALEHIKCLRVQGGGSMQAVMG
jgi:hypothetical protein